ncbi:hypothetical protein ZYGR_0AD03610 [Zygosaccharomyces rouxii]|uniref:F-box domain-containing protein n=1 Tax=Zygosaccharomyces rouxii TaxID=4956 RepID=A0A1Q3A686_ZYGRO|nr:hypothetical protein ZYGR_0AD03610 [Zygosaccharomyces rouxii]
MEEEPLGKALKLGATFYRNENYRRALELFRRCLQLAKSYPEQELIKLRTRLGLPKYNCPRSDKIYHPHYVQLLDNVAACYEKLAEFGMASEYTKRLIKVEPFNAKAYVRLQRLLQRRGKLDEAYGICKRGISNCKKFQEKYGIVIPSKPFEVLQRCEKSLQERIGPSEPVNKRHIIEPDIPVVEAKKQKPERIVLDFISGLPPELLPLILGGLTSKELIEVALVCKCWWNCVFAQPRLFQRVVINNGTYRQLNKFCEFAKRIRDRHGSLDLFKYSSRTPSDEAKSMEIFWTKLQGYKCRRLLLSVPRCTTEQLAQCMSRNTQLCQSLQELSMVVSLSSSKPDFDADMLNHCEHLKRLEIVVSSCTSPNRIPELSRSSSFIETKLIPTWATNLVSLSICCDGARVDRFPFLTMISYFPANKLERLCITGVTFNQLPNQFDWLANFRYLKEIWFEDNKGASLAVFLQLLRDYPLGDRLEKLTFREYSTLSNIHLEPTSESYFYTYNLQNVKSLDLMGSSISGKGLQRLVSYLQPLNFRRLNIGYCPHIRLERYQHENDPSYLSATNFFMKFPYLQELIIPQFGALDDGKMKLLFEQTANWYHLRKIDLSLNLSITGVSVYELLKALLDTRGYPLEHLIIDGCSSISHVTVNMIRAKGLASQVDCIYERDTWRRFGVNSLKYHANK